MSGLRNKHRKFKYVNPEWEEGSSWTIRSELTDDDTEAIEALTRTYVVKGLDDDELKAATKAGKNPRDIIVSHIQPEIIMSGKRATLLHLSDKWEGPHFTFPEDYTTEDAEGNEVPDKRAGQLAELNAESIGLLSTEDIDAVYWTMSELWAGAERSPEEQADFSGVVLRLDENRSRQSPQTGQAKTTRTRRVPKAKNGTGGESVE